MDVVPDRASFLRGADTAAPPAMARKVSRQLRMFIFSHFSQQKCEQALFVHKVALVAKYRRLGAPGTKLRCHRTETVFNVLPQI
jgi:hypothetical protein